MGGGSLGWGQPLVPRWACMAIPSPMHQPPQADLPHLPDLSNLSKNQLVQYLRLGHAWGWHHAHAMQVGAMGEMTTPHPLTSPALCHMAGYVFW
jgi:hypothetical protein